MTSESPPDKPQCDRFWLLTTTTYGDWLPGDERGFVSNVRDGPGAEVRHNIPGTPYDRNMPALEQAARTKLKCAPIRLLREQAEKLWQQFQETAAYRRWQLLAVGIMAQHVHIVVGVPGDPKPEDLLRDFKSYGSRALNGHWPRPASGTWWTESGSKRKLPNEAAVLAAINYVLQQEHPLLIWTAPIPELDLPGGRIV
jgi:REP element-mobilizing transposase RayT